MVHWLEIPQTTRAYVLVDAPAEPVCMILGFHGYAERPAHCLEGLRRAGIDDALLVGPMAQHHFYNREGKVVASWMTKFHREHQVEQILSYATGLVDQLRDAYGELPLYVFGFSQGASTAYRVGALGGLDVRRIFALAGDMPPELVESLDRVEPRPVSILLGKADRRADGATLEADRDRLEAAGWPAELLVVAGGHEYAPEAMRMLGRRIREDLLSM